MLLRAGAWWPRDSVPPEPQARGRGWEDAEFTKVAHQGKTWIYLWLPGKSQPQQSGPRQGSGRGLQADF